MTKTKILVTGGAGFVGSHLCERLTLDKSNEVTSLDNYFTGTINNHADGVRYIDGNTKNISQLIDFIPDIIYHLGEYSRVEQSFDDLRTVWDYNMNGTFEVLEFVRRTGCKLVYAGSSTKFADGGVGPSTNPYAWTKARNTELVKAYGDWFNIKYAITYFYNVYGRNEISTGKYATLIALFIDKMKRGDALSVVKPGDQTRNFTHVDDIIDGLLLVGENGAGDEFGIGSQEAFSIIEVAELFGGEVKMLPSRNGNRMTGDVVTKNTEALGWKAKRNLREYIYQLRVDGWQ